MFKRIFSCALVLCLILSMVVVPNLAVAADNKLVWSSTVQESTGDVGDYTQVRGLTYGQGKFVFVTGSVADQVIKFSQNGSSWSTATVSGTGPKGYLQDIAYNGNNTFVAVGNPQVTGAAPTIIVSTDGGATWTSDGISIPSTPTMNGSVLRCITWDGSKFIAANQNTRIIVSSDGLTWTDVAAPAASIKHNAIAFSGSIYVAVGMAGKIKKSTNRENWVDVAWDIPTMGASTNLWGVAYGNGKFIAVGDGGKILSSTDGNSWTITTPSGVTNHFGKVRFINGKFYAVGSQGKVLVSANGTDWVDESITALSTSTKILYGIARSDNGIYVVVGDGALNSTPVAGGVVATAVVPRAYISSPTSINEDPAINDGTLQQTTLTVPFTACTPAADITKSDVTVTGIPAGITYDVAYDVTTPSQITITLSGKATDHQPANNTTLNVTISKSKVLDLNNNTLLEDLTTSIPVNFTINPEFTMTVTTSVQQLVANQLFVATAQATNISPTNTTHEALLVVALYDSQDAFVNVSYITKTISARTTETISAGFKLPANVTGHKVKIMLLEGNDINSSNSLLALAPPTVISAPAAQ